MVTGECQDYQFPCSEMDLPIMGSDLQRKLSVANTRYMDKQKVSSVRKGEVTGTDGS